MALDIGGLLNGRNVGNTKAYTQPSDGVVSLDSLDALVNSLTSPELQSPTERNITATQSAQPTPPTTLSQLVSVAKSSGLDKIGTIDLSPQAQETVEVTTQTLAQTKNVDSTTAALGNTVDIKS